MIAEEDAVSDKVSIHAPVMDANYSFCYRFAA